MNIIIHLEIVHHLVQIYGNSTSFDSNISTDVNNMIAPQTQVIQQNDNIQLAIYYVSTHNYRPSEAFCTFKFWQLFVISTLNVVVFLFRKMKLQIEYNGWLM